MCSRTTGIPCQTFLSAVETLDQLEPYTLDPANWDPWTPYFSCLHSLDVDLMDTLGWPMLLLDRAVPQYDPTFIMLAI